MTDRIRDYLRTLKDHAGPVLVLDLEQVRDNYNSLRQGLARHARVLRREGQSGAGSAVAAGQARLLLRHRLDPEIEMALAAGATLTASATATPSRKSAISRAPSRSASGCSRSIAGGGREDRPRGARLEGVLPHPLRLRRGGMAAVAQIRLRPRDGGRRARACAQARPDRAWPLLPCRLAATRSVVLGPRP